MYIYSIISMRNKSVMTFLYVNKYLSIYIIAGILTNFPSWQTIELLFIQIQPLSAKQDIIIFFLFYY